MVSSINLEPFIIPRTVFIENKKLLGMVIKIKNIPGSLEKVLEVFANNKINVESVTGNTGGNVEYVDVFIVIDYSKEIEKENLKNEITKLPNVKNLNFIENIHDSIVADTLHYPLYIIPNLQAIIFTNISIGGMFEYIIQRFGEEIAKTLFWHMGYSIGKNVYDFWYNKIKDNEKTAKILFNQGIAFGWYYGKLNVDFKSKSYEVTLYNNFECSLLKKHKLGSHFLRGAFEGVYEKVFNEKVFLNEEKCIQKEEEYCYFVKT